MRPSTAPGWMADYDRAANADAYALGEKQRNGFKVRRVVWGLLLARAEKRHGEEIRRVMLWVSASPRR
jgi:hypothetical protein